MEEDKLRRPPSAAELAGQHVLAPALDDRRVGRDVRVSGQRFHSVAAQAYVASTI